MKIIGHRGAHGLAPENTIVSIEKAIEHGVDMIEFDVRVTKDGYAVLHHDGHLTDPNGNQLNISQSNLSELITHKPDLALLNEAIKAINHRAQMLIEVKPDVVIEPIVTVIDKCLKTGWKSDEITCCSFSFKILKQLRQALPDLKIMVTERWSGVRATHHARVLNTKSISMNHHVLWWGFIKSMNNAGYELYTYTLNDTSKARKWAKYGLAGVITDYPDQFEKLN